MYDLFNGLGSLLKLNEICIDNNVFRLHYKLTTVILIIFSIVNTSQQYIGDPIDCIMDNVPNNIMDVYCWITSTFTVVNKFGRKGIDVAQNGVASYSEDQDEIKHHKYYQWVCFVLFLQAVLFYIPRYIWKIWEGGKTRTLSIDLKFVSKECETVKARCQTVCEYFERNLNHHNLYFFRYALCELLNLINVIGQIFLLDRFLGGEFSTYGLDVIKFMESDTQKRMDPMSRVFPKMAKCTFHKYGPSGTIQRVDGLCVLPINVLNEKMYIFLWFWFLMLFIVTSLGIIYRISTMISRRVRFYLLKSRIRLGSNKDIKYLSKRLKIGDWFMLYQISKNVDVFALKNITKDLTMCLREKETINSLSKRT